MIYIIGVMEYPEGSKVEGYESDNAPDELAPIERCATYSRSRDLVRHYQSALDRGELRRMEASTGKPYVWYD